MRAEFPSVIEVADLIRSSLPDPSSVRLVYAEEGGKRIGKAPSEFELTWHGSHVPSERKRK